MGRLALAAGGAGSGRTVSVIGFFVLVLILLKRLDRMF
jgi:hypothetical protein